MSDTTKKQQFETLFADVDGYSLSRQVQNKLNYFYTANVYGEIDFDSFSEILKVAKPKEKEVFYDLGSGTGKAVIVSALCFPFAKCIGIEKMIDLHVASQTVADKLSSAYVQFIHSDFNDVDFTDADVLYMNSYYFRYEMYNNFFKNKMRCLKKGSRVITVRVPYISEEFAIVHEKAYKFSWGEAMVQISEKIA
jgi:trans-aconitate methyltransferase